MAEPLLVIVGAADTGRAPMTAALLRRLLASHGHHWRVESAGVVGHDGDPAEPEARDALLTLGLDLDSHSARSLSAALVAEARLLIAVERGVARVVRTSYPTASVTTLGELAGRSRDIPDPFRMQVGAWLQYAREIEAMLLAGLPRLQTLLAGEAMPPATTPAPTIAAPAAPPVEATTRGAAVERMTRLLTLAAELPAVVDWVAARRQIEADFGLIEQTLPPGDLARPYLAVLRAILKLCGEAPTAERLSMLRGAVARLREPLVASDLDRLSRELADFA